VFRAGLEEKKIGVDTWFCFGLKEVDEDEKRMTDGFHIAIIFLRKN